MVYLRANLEDDVEEDQLLRDQARVRAFGRVVGAEHQPAAARARFIDIFSLT